jgi:hypothetical protein
MKNISRYSNLVDVREKAKELLGKNSNIEISTRKDKKYMIEDPLTNKKIHFGQMGYEDYTKHKDERRRDLFLERNKKWREAPQNSPAWLSYHLLW